MIRGRRIAAATAVVALTAAGCGSDGTSIAGAGASSQEIAMQAWLAGLHDLQPEILTSYDPTGSGAGREMFITGAVDFAGSDAHLDDEEALEAEERCEGGEVLELPLYISPIAIAYHLPGLDVEHLQLAPETIAGMFDGRIERWDDPAIIATNPGVELPDLQVVPVNRSDDSGTTENFTEYLAEAGGGAWPHEPSGTWPRSGTHSGQQNVGMVSTLEAAEGTIGYVDASQVTEELGTVAVGVGEEFVPFSPEAAAAVVDASPPAPGASDTRLVIELDRDTDAAGAYPVVLISYTIACTRYDSAEKADSVRALLSYIASEDGQARAASPEVAGAAPISADLRERVMAAVDRIEGPATG
ncbi:phosphate ABC transporter substrate-binding protein PstS [Georgenia satyanarayanai]|uniref:phosphate ABC transporter substrate-binding protein PstS n=1 Tax=Georgenia satyanarayanai TaxID=860221 RepID=UPI00203D0F9B|nr:phosphate ABC transporter substrate-binding protein PstS [Georgenia satyanarayanai]MCM3662000.1 phosphate ABC transporter substrate-binding protein PstS [Georgenia satyanarayanai]